MGIETLEEILGHACLLAVSPTREIAESALSYIKVYITVMPSLIIAKTLTKIVSETVYDIRLFTDSMIFLNSLIFV